MSQLFFTIFGTYWYPSLYVTVRNIFSFVLSSFSFGLFFKRSSRDCFDTSFSAFYTIVVVTMVTNMVTNCILVLNSYPATQCNPNVTGRLEGVRPVHAMQPGYTPLSSVPSGHGSIGCTKSSFHEINSFGVISFFSKGIEKQGIQQNVA